MSKLFVLVGAALAALVLVVASPAAASGTTCNSDTPLTGQTIQGNLIVPADGTCTIVDTTVTGDVKVGDNAYFEANHSSIGDDVEGRETATLYLHDGSSVGDDVRGTETFQMFVFDASVGGDIEAKGNTDTVNLCGNTVGDDIEVTRSAHDILVGDPATVDCAGNTVGDHLTVSRNTVDAELIVRGNTVEDDLTVSHNKNADTNPLTAKAVDDNVGGEELECKGNDEPFEASGNTGWDNSEGQCEIPPTECNDPNNPTTGSIAGDLVVPTDGVCVLTGATVGGNVRVGKRAYFEASGSQIAGDVRGHRSTTVYLHDGNTVGGGVETSHTFQSLVFDSAAEDVEVNDNTGMVNVCGNQVTNDIEVTSSGLDILVGDPLSGGCAGNTVGDDIEIIGNEVDVELIVRGNTVTDDLKVFNNESISGSGAPKSVDSNTGGDSLECFGNNDPFTGSPNTGFASADGQCSSV